jgi:hypothetical protein
MTDKTDSPDSDEQREKFPAGGQVSEGPSSMTSMETALGGADSVPDTPDTVPYPEADNASE